MVWRSRTAGGSAGPRRPSRHVHRGAGRRVAGCDRGVPTPSTLSRTGLVGPPAGIGTKPVALVPESQKPTLAELVGVEVDAPVEPGRRHGRTGRDSQRGTARVVRRGVAVDVDVGHVEVVVRRAGPGVERGAGRTATPGEVAGRAGAGQAGVADPEQVAVDGQVLVRDERGDDGSTRPRRRGARAERRPDRTGRRMRPGWPAGSAWWCAASSPGQQLGHPRVHPDLCDWPRRTKRHAVKRRIQLPLRPQRFVTQSALFAQQNQVRTWR